ncbi:MAG: lipid-A-disaccharide synthase [Bacteroidales bacterium]|nr:lipid-A-disaccharide synthase [Bacteroidales bacterium]
MKYYLIVGEASGDLHASNLMQALKHQDAEADFRFYGGDLMRRQGGHQVLHYRELAYMGFIPVLLHLRTILRNMRRCKEDIVQWRPDVLILVDYPGFNLNIAAYIRQHSDIPIYYYISPKIWAWKEYRIKAIKRDIDHLFSILPFEVEFYRLHHCQVHYVGNPCVDAVESFKASSPQVKPSKPIIAILAGSRKQEIKDNLDIMLRAVTPFADRYDLVVAGAPGIDESYYQRFMHCYPQVRLRFASTYNILQQAHAAVVTSGTATLETSLFRVPQVVCYYVPFGPLVNLIRRRLIKVPYISLVNLIAGKEVVKELVANAMTAENIHKNLAPLLDDNSSARQQMIEDYEQLAQTLGQAGASETAARQMLRYLNDEPTASRNTNRLFGSSHP